MVEGPRGEVDGFCVWDVVSSSASDSWWVFGSFFKSYRVGGERETRVIDALLGSSACDFDAVLVDTQSSHQSEWVFGRPRSRGLFGDNFGSFAYVIGADRLGIGELPIATGSLVGVLAEMEVLTYDFAWSVLPSQCHLDIGSPVVRWGGSSVYPTHSEKFGAGALLAERMDALGPRVGWSLLMFSGDFPFRGCPPFVPHGSAREALEARVLRETRQAS